MNIDRCGPKTQNKIKQMYFNFLCQGQNPGAHVGKTSALLLDYAQGLKVPSKGEKRDKALSDDNLFTFYFFSFGREG